VLLFALVGALLAFTAYALLVPGLFFVAIGQELDQLMNTAATVIAGGIALLAWFRFRETGQTDSLYQAMAFLALFTGAAVATAIVVTDHDDAMGFSRATPGQAPLYIWTAQRLLAAPLLLVGAVAALRTSSWRPHQSRSVLLLALTPAALLLMVTAVVLSLRRILPDLIPTPTLNLLTQRVSNFDVSLLSLPIVVTQLVVAAAYIAAAGAYAAAYIRSRRTRPDLEDAQTSPPYVGRPYLGYLAAGLAVAAFAQIHFAIVPGAYNGLVTSGDILRLAFYILVGHGVAVAARQDLSELRLANLRLRELRASDTERITLEERARLAREVHDGLVQDLWLARLTHGRLSQALEKTPDMAAETRLVAQQVDRALEDALAGARQAVVSLQPSEDGTFGSLLRHVAEDYGDHFGLEVECTIEGEPIVLGGHTQAEVLRICREALNNARKHADASVVRVRLESDGSLIRLTVADNGRGFNPGRTPRAGFGLKSMAARAREVGGRLRIDSQPMNGTRVILELPPPQSAG
jgi:signal transduction histidine kinase